MFSVSNTRHRPALTHRKLRVRWQRRRRATRPGSFMPVNDLREHAFKNCWCSHFMTSGPLRRQSCLLRPRRGPLKQEAIHEENTEN